ncbi:MAG: alanine--tRNA ligase [bacterium]|nr:alanine--tRNA ligase [bacterium]
MPDTSSHTAARVRRDFHDFFVSKEHREVPSGPVFPQDDPTLLFTNAGMNQFKDVFLGTGTRDYKRAADTQKCIRVSGKHNDLEEVGRDTYHHTFFEMLGNWSFGDYFKEDAIIWAWELLTKVWGLPKERLWATVFEGNAKDGLAADEEAERIWREKTDIDPSHVLRCPKEDNFWEMGATGPCGPCSEIHIDRGGPGADPTDGADPKIGVNAGNERFIELWNLVFMQFNRQDDGSLVELPAKSVDTGMGFERILSVLQGKSSNYDTDLFSPLFARLEELTGKRYGTNDEETNVAFRVCADHMRAVSSAFGDGALPSNEGRGYVLRRLIRRASRFGRQVLGVEEPFLFALAPTIAEVLGEAFPEIPARLDHIQLLIKSEEESFRKTLDRGLVLFEDLARKVSKGGAKTLPGDEAYELYATFGFPQDLVELMARERGMDVDLEGWSKAQSAHREISKSEGKFKQLLSPEQLSGIQPTESTYHRASGSTTDGEGAVVAAHPHEAGHVLVLDKSPFYAESGGQVGDTGRIEASDGSFVFEVADTQKIGDVVAHVGKLTKGAAAAGAAVEAHVDAERRAAIRANHTATHLMHKALREVLGEHVTQQGSYVGPDRLRFDLSQPKGVTSEEVAEIERRVNLHVLGNQTVQTTVENTDEAKARGVVALFGEKYGDSVRVVDVGGWSTEFCGGTHVSAAGDIGPFVILSERAIQAGVRRIEALTHTAAVEYIQEQRRLLAEIAGTLKVQASEVPERLGQMQKQLKDAKKKQKAAAAGDVGAELERVKAELEDRGGVKTGWARTELDANGLRDLAGRLKGLAPDLAVGVFGRDGDKVPYLIVCQGSAQAAGLKAGELAKEVGKHIRGGGGGKPDVAQGQGTHVGGIPASGAFLSERFSVLPG